MTRFPDDVPLLSDGVVVLRAHRPEDLARIVEQCQDPETLRWTTVPRPYGPEQAEDFLTHVREGWEADTTHYWAIEEVAQPGVFLGTVDLRRRAPGVAETGFGLHPQGRGRGLMARALRLACRWWFDECDGIRVHWLAEVGNEASWAVARACGFTWHGTLPDLIEQPTGTVSAWRASVGASDDLSTPLTPWPALPEVDLGPVRLRAWRPEDVASVEEFTHPVHFVPVRSLPTVENFAQRVARRRELLMLGQGVEWCIADSATDRALGWVTVFVHGGSLDDDDVAELGYCLYPSGQGHGYAATASRYAVDFAFRPREAGGLGLRRLVGHTAADNIASNRTLERLGFSLFGREREVDVLPDRTEDLLYWDLLARDWSA